MTVPTAEQTLTFERTIQAPISEVYRSFTHRDGLNDWFANGSNVNAVVGGHFLIYWQDNIFTVGEYKALDENSKIVFTWRANVEQEDSLVTINLMQENDYVVLNLTHENLPEEAGLEIYTWQWNQVLDNLKSTLETGADKRITDRVIIGIIPGAVSKEQAELTGLEEGIYAVVDSLIEGYSAAEAGIQAGDIITNVNGKILTADLSIFNIVQEFGLKPDDRVQITYYRDGQVHTVPVTLKGYPVPEIPANFQELADRIKTQNTGYKQILAELFDGISDDEAFKKPAEGEWSAAENLAHLILTERWIQNWVGGLLQGPEISGYTANADARIASVTAVYPTKQAILDAMHRAWDETEALLRAISEEHLVRKTNLWWTTFELSQFEWHTQQHFNQIKNTLNS